MVSQFGPTEPRITKQFYMDSFAPLRYMPQSTNHPLVVVSSLHLSYSSRASLRSHLVTSAFLMICLFLFFLFSYLSPTSFFSFPESPSYIYVPTTHTHTGTHAHLRFRQVPEFFPFVSKLSPGIVVAKRSKKPNLVSFYSPTFRRTGDGGRRKKTT